MEPKAVLSKLGLSADEIAVYLACLGAGDASVQEIAKISGVKRTSVYPIAASLEGRGLIGRYETRRGVRLAAEKPERLLSQLEERAVEVAAAIPELKALSRQEEHHPQVKYFEGKEGYFSICEDTLETHLSEILWFGDPSGIYAVIGEDYDNKHYIPMRLKRKIKLRALLVPNEWSEKLMGQKNHELMREVRLLPEGLPIRSAQFIYGNKVALTSSTEELVSVLIESRDFADAERAKFELMWQ